MQEDPARLTILIDPKLKEAFQVVCASRDLTASQMVRQLIHEYLARHGAGPAVGGEKPPDVEA